MDEKWVLPISNCQRLPLGRLPRVLQRDLSRQMSYRQRHARSHSIIIVIIIVVVVVVVTIFIQTQCTYIVIIIPRSRAAETCNWNDPVRKLTFDNIMFMRREKKCWCENDYRYHHESMSGPHTETAQFASQCRLKTCEINNAEIDFTHSGWRRVYNSPERSW